MPTRTAGRWLVLLAAAWLCFSEANAIPVRQTWLFEQLSELPPPTTAEETRHSVGASLVTYPDTLSWQLSGVLDFREFEIYAAGARRFFYEPNGPYAQSLRYQRDDLSLEIARYHALSKSAYGRLGLGVVKFFESVSAPSEALAAPAQSKPDKQLWVHLAINTGLLPHEELPWNFRLGLGLFVRTDDAWYVVTTRMEALREFAEGHLKIGGYFGWSYIVLGSTNDFRVTTPNSAPVLEHYGFTLGPEIEWNFFAGRLQISMPLRLYLDQDVSQSSATPSGPTFYTSEFLTPALAANLYLQF